MDVKKVFITNYREFRSTFHDDVEAYCVMGRLQKMVEDDLRENETAHVNMFYGPYYDDEGFALFDVTRVRVYHDTVEVQVEYTGTVK